MALVAYSDSESSDTEAPPAAKAPTFSKPESRKIKVALPTLQAEPQLSDRPSAGDEPPAKRARTAGAFGGFNSLLPAPKRAAGVAQATTGVRKGVNLRTSSEAAFSRGVVGANVAEGGGVGLEVRGEEDGEGYDEFGDKARVVGAGVEGVEVKGGVELRVVGKATRFKPLSVANKRKKPVGGKKAVAAPAAATTETHIAVDDVRKPATEGGAIPQEVAPVVPKPKRSLFAVQQEEELFGRSSLNNSHNPQTPNLVHFNTDTEYAANETLRQSTGETEAHRAVKTVAPGKHSLQQLVNNARVNQEGIEDKWAEGRRKRGEGGSAYGWGK
ncbi:hypothetical protein LTR48_006955 [Friedmanniomyces endolithicus]|uniref:Mitotic checkpoint regulator, MAD2B-interacting-domain-containing protein n=1 Tax=Rachicladosporium monterosium TaxID=1507873 RepID=A0ABR0KXN8_9PEZI|nr:hypothetical protein LTR48_006955 [Friedmanniomyces endolithicus]KAK5140183.1 hypothetical protein LTR32_006946 [Rachicladosporium monterosium]